VRKNRLYTGSMARWFIRACCESESSAWCGAGPGAQPRRRARSGPRTTATVTNLMMSSGSMLATRVPVPARHWQLAGSLTPQGHCTHWQSQAALRSPGPAGTGPGPRPGGPSHWARPPASARRASGRVWPAGGHISKSGFDYLMII
jgi:hypothetical protein